MAANNHTKYDEDFKKSLVSLTIMDVVDINCSGDDSNKIEKHNIRLRKNTKIF